MTKELTKRSKFLRSRWNIYRFLNLMKSKIYIYTVHIYVLCFPLGKLKKLRLVSRLKFGSQLWKSKNIIDLPLKYLNIRYIDYVHNNLYCKDGAHKEMQHWILSETGSQILHVIVERFFCCIVYHKIKILPPIDPKSYVFMVLISRKMTFSIWIRCGWWWCVSLQLVSNWTRGEFEKGRY